jgi:hypothetical protein
MISKETAGVSRLWRAEVFPLRTHHLLGGCVDLEWDQVVGLDVSRLRRTNKSAVEMENLEAQVMSSL